MFSTITSLLHWSTLSDAQKTEVKRSIFSLTDETVRDKIVFGFFLDHFSPITQLDAQKREKLDHLGFMAGSLTSKEFAALLEEFLSQPGIAKEFTPETLAILHEYVETIKAAQAQGELVDLLRSSDFRLILFAATGNDFWSVEQTSSSSQQEIDLLQAHILQEIQTMKIGDKRLFLLGTLMHETRLYLEKTDDHSFQLTYYDTDRDNTVQIHRMDETALLDPAFWRPLCEAKLGYTKETTDKVCKWIQKHFTEKAGDTLTPDKAGVIAKQKENTCHFRSLFAPLKTRIIEANRDKGYGGYLEWHHCKIALGAFLLAKNASRTDAHSPALQELSQKTQEIRKEKQALRLEIAKAAKDDSSYQSALEAFSTLFSNFFPSLSVMEAIKKAPYAASKAGNLDILCNAFFAECKSVGLHPDQMAPFIQKIDHPLIQQAFLHYTKQAERARAPLLSGELTQKLQGMTATSKFLSDQWHTVKTALTPKKEGEPEKSEAPQPAIPLPPISDKELDELIDLLIHKKEDLVAVSKQFLIDVINRALRIGHFEKADLLRDAILPHNEGFLSASWAAEQQLHFFTPMATLLPNMANVMPKAHFFNRSSSVLLSLQIQQNPQSQALRNITLLGSTPGLIKSIEKIDIPPSAIPEAFTLFDMLANSKESQDHVIASSLIVAIFLSLYRQNPKVSVREIALSLTMASWPQNCLSNIIDSIEWMQQYDKGQFEALSPKPRYLAEVIACSPKPPSFTFTKDNYMTGLAYLMKIRNQLWESSPQEIILYRDLLYFAIKPENLELRPTLFKSLNPYKNTIEGVMHDILNQLPAQKLVELLQDLAISSDFATNLNTYAILETLLKREGEIDDYLFFQIDALFPQLDWLFGGEKQAKIFSTLKPFIYKYPESHLSRLYRASKTKKV